MAARDYLSGVVEDATREHKEFRENASISDYVREGLKMFVAAAILYRVTAHMYVATLNDIAVPEDDVNWTVFGPAVDNTSTTVDVTTRVAQAVFFSIATLGGSGAAFHGGPGVAVIASLNASILIVDPVLFVIDYLEA